MTRPNPMAEFPGMMAKELEDGYDGCLSVELHNLQLPHPHLVVHGIFFDERDEHEPMSVAAYCSLHMTADDKALATAEHTPPPGLTAEQWDEAEANLAESAMVVGYTAFLNHLHEVHPDQMKNWPGADQISAWLSKVPDGNV